MDSTLLKYVRDFSAQVSQYRAHKTEESLALLSHTVSILSTRLQQHELNVQHLHVAKFFIDLHAVMSTLSTDSYALWSCIAILQQCSRHENMRQVLVEQYRFVPMLTNILEGTHAPEKLLKLFHLLQELTYDIKIDFEEPYVTLLLSKLISFIEASAEGPTENASAQAVLSILINLCKKNVLVLFMLLRKINLSQFSRKINQFGMPGTQLIVILSKEINSVNVQELQLFLRSFFADIVETVKIWNVPKLRNSVEFLLDSSSQSNLRECILKYTHFNEDISNILKQLQSCGVQPETATEAQQMCMESIFKLLRFIYEQKAENGINLDDLVQTYKLLCPWTKSAICGKEAVHLLESLILYDQKNAVLQCMKQDSDNTLLDLIDISEKEESPPVLVTKILQVLLLLLEKSKMLNTILSRISDSYFDQMFAPLLKSTATAGTSNWSVNEVEKATFSLLLLIKFADTAKNAYHEKCCQMLQMTEIQRALSMAILHGSKEACSAIFQMSQFEHFPQQLVAQQIAISNKLQLNAHNNSSATDNWQHFNAILTTQHALVGKEMQERMQALIESIECAQKENKLHNLQTSRIVELFSYERDNFNISEQNMRMRLEQTSQEITHLTQRLSVQNVQLQEYRTLNFQKALNEESLTTFCKDLKQQKLELGKNNAELMKKLAEKTEILESSNKRLLLIRKKLQEIEEKYNVTQKSLKTTTEQNDKLQLAVKENTQRIETLKKTITAIDEDNKTKSLRVEELEKELEATNQKLEEQIHKKESADGIIATYEKELREKNFQLEQCEQELRETEEMRKTIMSLMENKKRRR